MKKHTNLLFKRGLAVFLVLAMCVSMLQMTAFAAGDPADEEPTAADSNGNEYQSEYYEASPSDDSEEPKSSDNSGETQKEENNTADGEETTWTETVGPEDDSHEVDITGTQTKDKETGEIVKEEGTGSYEDATKGDGTVDVTHKEETTEKDPEEVPVQPGDPSVRPVNPENPDSDGSVSVVVTPDSPQDPVSKKPTGSTDFTVDPNKVVVPEPEPDKTKYTQDSEGNWTYTDPDTTYKDEDEHEGTKKTTSTWKTEKLSEGNGYKTTETTITTTEVRVPNVPENKPSDAVDLPDGSGYQYTKNDTDAEGHEIEVIVTVTNGETITKTRTIKTVETIQEVVVDPETGEGKVIVSMGDVAGETNVEGSYTSIDANGVRTKYSTVGYDKDNDLYNRQDSKSVTTVTTSGNYNVRNKPSTKNSKIWSTLPSGSTIYVYEQEGNWLRIGDNAWISKDSVGSVSSGTFTVNSGKGTNQYVYEDPATADTNEKGSASRAKGATVWVDEIKTVNGVEWCHINSDGNLGGWMLRSSLTVAYGSAQVTGKDPTLANGGIYGKDPNGQIESDKHDFKNFEYFFMGEYGLESSIRVSLNEIVLDENGEPKVDENGNIITKSGGRYQAHQFILRDKDMNKYYVYCAELGTNPKTGYDYKLIPLENVSSEEGNENYVGHLTPDDVRHLRAIAQNGYWATKDGSSEEGNLGSLKALKEKLLASGIKQEIVDNITPGIAISATQAALWVYGNTGELEVNQNTDAWRSYLGIFYNTTDKEVENTWNIIPPEKQAALEAVFKWLVDAKLDESGPHTPEPITKENFQVTEAKVTVTGTTGSEEESSSGNDVKEIMYKADVEFALNVTSGEGDKLYVEVYVKDKDENITIQKKCSLADANGKISGQDGIVFEGGKYKISGITLPNGAKLDIKLTGTQDLGKGVYVFKSEEKDGQHSQTFIGLSEDNAKQNVDLTVTLDFNVTEAKATITTRETVTETTEKWSQNTRHEDEDRPPRTPDTPTTPPGDDPTPTPTPRTPETPPVEVPTEPTPLTEVPSEETPLAQAPEEETLEEIPEEDVPLADVPATGDISVMWYAMSILAACGLMFMNALDGKKRRDGES